MVLLDVLIKLRAEGLEQEEADEAGSSDLAGTSAEDLGDRIDDHHENEEGEDDDEHNDSSEGFHCSDCLSDAEKDDCEDVYDDALLQFVQSL